MHLNGEEKRDLKALVEEKRLRVYLHSRDYLFLNSLHLFCVMIDTLKKKLKINFLKHTNFTEERK